MISGQNCSSKEEMSMSASTALLRQSSWQKSLRCSGMLNDARGFEHIYLCCGYTDLRKGIDSLISVVTSSFGLDPALPGSIFLFCGSQTQSALLEQNKKLTKKIEDLTEQIAILNQNRFGKHSETAKQIEGPLSFNDFGVDILNEAESATESGIGDEKDITDREYVSVLFKKSEVCVIHENILLLDLWCL